MEFGMFPGSNLTSLVPTSFYVVDIPNEPQSLNPATKNEKTVAICIRCSYQSKYDGSQVSPADSPLRFLPSPFMHILFQHNLTVSIAGYHTPARWLVCTEP